MAFNTNLQQEIARKQQAIQKALQSLNNTNTDFLSNFSGFHTVYSSAWDMLEPILGQLSSLPYTSSHTDESTQKCSTFHKYQCNINTLFAALECTININDEEQLQHIITNYLGENIYLDILHFFLKKHFVSFFSFLNAQQNYPLDILRSTYCQRMILFYFTHPNSQTIFTEAPQDSALYDFPIEDYYIGDFRTCSLPFWFHFVMICAIHNRDINALTKLAQMLDNQLKSELLSIIKFSNFNLSDSDDTSIITILTNQFNIPESTLGLPVSSNAASLPQPATTMHPDDFNALVTSLNTQLVDQFNQPAEQVDDTKQLDEEAQEIEVQSVTYTSLAAQLSQARLAVAAYSQPATLLGDKFQGVPITHENTVQQLMPPAVDDSTELSRVYFTLQHYIETLDKTIFEKNIRNYSIKALDEDVQEYITRKYPSRPFESLLATALFIEQCIMNLFTDSPEFGEKQLTAKRHTQKVMGALSKRFSKATQAEKNVHFLVYPLLIIQHLLQKEHEENYNSDINLPDILSRFLVQCPDPNILMHNQWLLAYLLYYGRLHPFKIVEFEQKSDSTLLRDGIMSCLTAAVYSAEESRSLALMKLLPIQPLSNLAKTLIAIWATQLGNIEILNVLHRSHNGTDSFDLATCPVLYDDYPTLLFFAAVYLSDDIGKLSAVLSVLCETDINFNTQNAQGSYAIDLAKNKEEQKQFKLARKQQIIRQKSLPIKDYTIDLQRNSGLFKRKKTSTRKELEDYFTQYF